jgi:hypothetical protein
MITREALITRLLALAGLVSRLLDLASEIAAAEEDACQAAIELAAAKATLEAAEHACYLGSGVEGRNAEERKARVHAATLPAQDACQDALEAHQRASMRLRVLMSESSILRAVSRLRAAGDDDA